MARNHCFAGVHTSCHAIQGFVSKLKNLIQRVRRSSVSVVLICSVPRTNFIAKCKIFRVLLELILRYLFKPRNLAIIYYRGQMAFDLETTIKVLRLN